ncbi:unnamed protein product [Zymoseptoria tritici ST99CH_1E4]|uniref:C2H2-type domain-containing protein n=1 Tax=Zymoseptoria tritici ST99CH_1E4 TaxID=1276532 RepID=A0A2H1GXJ5_ZYMTR|nr:unnamed protein product [Zymoseptoria tritici ST99CH_1E4]
MAPTTPASGDGPSPAAEKFRLDLEFLKRQHIPRAEFLPLLEDDLESTARYFASKLTPCGEKLLSINLSDLTPAFFSEYESLSDDSLGSGVYAIVIRGPNGSWALYIGSTKHGFGPRLFSHVCTVSSTVDAQACRSIAQTCNEWNALPEMFELATTDEDERLGTEELIETLMIIATRTFQETKNHARVLRLVNANYATGQDQPIQYKGLNRALSVNQRICKRHKVTDVFECRNCNVEISGEKEYLQHLVDEHQDYDAPFICVKCDTRRYTAALFIAHYRGCGHYACEYPGCEHVSTIRSALNRHFKQCHDADAKKFVCNDCGKKFAWKDGLATHQAIMHSPPVLDPAHKNQCSTCLTVFGSQPPLEEHNRSPTACARNVKELHFPREEYPNHPEESQARAAIMGYESIPIPKFPLKNGTLSAIDGQRCTFYLGCTYFGQQVGRAHLDNHRKCPFCQNIFPHVIKPNQQLNRLIDAHIRKCKRDNGDIPQPEPKHPRFATLANFGLHVPPKF